jgi:hypothetical protein
MDIPKKSRAELKAYFVKNAIPTQGNFADLIDAMVNQKEDGVAKPAGNPLCIEAAGDAGGLKKAINFYESFGDANPAWAFSLNPRVAAGDPATSKPGFAISDPAGNNRLFIDRPSGNVGIGTIEPKGMLDVQAAPRTGTHPANRFLYVTGDSGEADGIEFRRSDGTQGIGLGYNTIYATGSFANQDLKLKPLGKGHVMVLGALTPSAGNTTETGIMFPENPGGGAGDAAWIRYYPRHGESCTLEIGISNDGDDDIALISSGNVGIGIIEPLSKLDVQAVPRTGSHPANRIMYVTGNSGEADGIEFRHTNGTQGVGFGYNTIYATGSNANQDLNLKPRGTGKIVVLGDLTVSGQTTVVHRQGWTNAVLLNGWVAWGNPYSTAAYMMDALGFVHLRGLVRSGRLGQAIFQLPAGLRPRFQHLHCKSHAAEGSGRIDVSVEGAVVASNGNNEWVSLDDISFLAEQ